ncbi:MAG TPA: GAF domain-containing protein, partial [Anaerolineae bacterium]|nr:GAF domain-containing protein [Anaerolineae bacterium]
MKTTKRSAPRKTPPSIKKKPVERRKPIGAAQPARSRQPDRPIASSPISELAAPDRSAQVQAALYAIASAASSVQDMQEFYAAMHRIVGQLMYAKNFFIALYDEPSDLLSFPYFVDEKDEVLPPQPLANFRGATGWVLRHGKTIADVDGSWATAKARGEAEEVGTVGEEGIAVPLKIENKTIGVVFIQSYTPGIGYQVGDVAILEFVAQHISTALTRARAIEETRQRNAELAIINSVQQGLVSKLDFQSIIDLAGDKLREIFGADTTYISLYDPPTNLGHTRYYVDRGQRLYFDPAPAVRGLTAWIFHQGRVLLLGTKEESSAYDAIQLPAGTDHTQDMNESYLGVPIVISAEVRGAISIQSYARHAFDQSHVRLLTALASSLSVALENARLFDETQRLFKAEEQRAAELSIVNSVQEGLASKLDMQSIYDLVGDKIREIFDAQVVIISIFDRVANQSTAYYAIERGVRLPNFTLPIRERILRYLDETHQPLTINTDAVQRSKEFGIEIVPGTESAKALVFAPLIVGDEVKGAISLQNLDRENAFSDSDIRLLQTLASSMSVALENARLFDEVQTRNQEITETLEQQTATSDILRVIAQSPTDVQPVLDVIARHAVHLIDGVFSAVYRVQGQMIDEVARANFTPSAIEVGRTSYPAPLAWDSSLSSRAVISRGVIHIPDTQNNPDIPEMTKRYAAVQNMQCILFVPMIREGDAIGSIGVGKNDPAPFTDKQITLLQTFAQQAVIAIENVRLFNELNTRNREITEALEQQTATSEILSVTANSPTDVQPVLDVVAEHSARLCDSYDALIVQVEGDHYRSIAQWGPVPTPAFDVPLNRDTVTGRAIIDRSIVHVADLLAEPESEFPLSRQFSQQLSGQRTLLAVPMLREGRAIGAIVIRRQEVNPFTDKQISLLQTFADQAAIAIENVRLFNETKRLLNETEQHAAELAVINSVQAGLASQLEMQSIYDLVGDKVREIFNADTTYIVSYDPDQQLVFSHYYVDKGQRQLPQHIPFGQGIYSRVIQTRQFVLAGTSEEGDQFGATHIPSPDSTDDLNQAALYVPIMLGAEVAGVVSVQSHQPHAYAEKDVRLLTTLANSMSVALENARLFDETQRLLKETNQRAAELSIINSVQQGLASKLDMQSIYDLVGDKIRDIFDARTMIISSYDHAAEMTIFNYSIEKGERYYPTPMPFTGLARHLIRTRQLVLVNEDMETRVSELGMRIVPGTELGKSALFVPLTVGDTVHGGIALYNYDRENAFSDSDVRLLTTLASSMSVALENARLFDETTRLLKETDQRAAELSIINSVQQGLASKLDMQSIYDLVGDKINEIFDVQGVGIMHYNHTTRQIHNPYVIERGQRFYPAPAPFTVFAENMIRTKQVVVINQDMERQMVDYGMRMVPGTEMAKAIAFVPLIVADQVNGVISLENIDHENAFSESDVRLLSTLASSMSVALENARLFDETQRLLKETDQRAAELAIINSVQQGLASKLDMQSIYDLVGDKIRDIFDAQVVMVLEHDHVQNLSLFRYTIEKGVRLHVEPRPPLGFSAHILKTRQTLVINQDMEQRSLELGSPVIAGDDIKSYLGVPLIVGDEVKGVISLQNIDRENAFSESDVRLLNTLASSMSVALENARLFDETQRLLKETDQRAAELSIINSVQQGLASKLDVQSVYDLVGEKIREIFDAQAVAIMIFDRRTNLLHYPYIIEKGERIRVDSDPFDDKGFAPYIIRTKQSLMFNTEVAKRAEEFGSYLLGGEEPKSYVGVPLISGDEARGVITLSNIDRENAFTDSDLRLLTTLSSSMSVALENARLFDETTRLLKETDQRAAELALINSVQEGLASKLDVQSVYDLVGDKIRDIFDAQVVQIMAYDRDANRCYWRYMIEKGERQYTDPTEPRGFSSYILKNAQPLMLNDRINDWWLEHLGTPPTVLKGEMAQSYLGVPLIIG